MRLSEPGPRVSSAVLAIIEEAYVDPDLRLGEIANKLGISCSYLQHLIKRETGASFTRHLHQTRTGAAAFLLTTTVLEVKEVVAKVGYANTASLERHFKVFFGSTPTAYRKEERRRAAMG